ncbi:MBL fold metallo-hydrolase [Streptomyces albidoflavus]
MVDSGLGTADRHDPEGRLGTEWVAYAQPARDPEESALRQIVRLGLGPRDVRHLVLTHLHRDHTGGLPDFPGARVHVYPAEYRAVTDPADPHHRHSLDRFLPAHRPHGPLLTPAVAGGSAEWFGFPGVARVAGLAGEVLLVPLPGHSAGHAGVAVRDGAGRWLLHAGDAYLYHGEIERTPPSAQPAFAPVQQGPRPTPRRSGPRATGCAPAPRPRGPGHRLQRARPLGVGPPHDAPAPARARAPGRLDWGACSPSSPLFRAPVPSRSAPRPRWRCWR